MEVSYYRDSIKNYMVIPSPNEVEGYKYRMLEMNQIEGILPCEVRFIDGVQYLYYEITGRQSLRSLFEDHRMSGSQFRHFLEAVDGISETLSKYLLDGSQLILAADQIFLDMHTGQFLFTYFPGKEEPVTVFRFLANVIDASDKTAAACAFRLCVLEEDNTTLFQIIHEEAAEPPFAYENSFGWRDNSGSGKKEQKIENELDIEDETESKKDRENKKNRKEAKIRSSKSSNGNKKEKESKRHNAKQNNEAEDPHCKESTDGSMSLFRKAGRTFLIILCILGAVGMIAAQYYLFMSEREARLCVVGAGLLFAGGALLTGDFISRIRKEKIRRQEAEKNLAFRDSEEDLYEYNSEKLNYDTIRLNGKDKDDSDTIFLRSGEAAGRLYGNGNSRGSRIDLEVLPITIGKAAAYADVLLEDPSVSRVHAKIYRTEKGEIAVKDLGSTNGTWIDGVRMNPNESKIIERGQEVKFGGIEYIYR